MDKPTTTRLPEEFITNLKFIAEKENLDVSSVLRRLLAGAFKEWKIKYALDMYSKGEFSFGQVSEFADVSVWDVPELFKKYNITINYDKEEFLKDLEVIKKWKKKK